MKLKTTLAASITLAVALVGCGEKTHVAHDHDGDGKPDHPPGQHGKHVPHDHDGDGKPDHGPGEHHNHDHPEKVAGPNGGKIMTSPDFKCEFLVTDDRKVRITFLDDANKPVAVGAQEITLVGGDRSAPTTLTFAAPSNKMSLISSETLPAGKSFPVILTVKVKPDAQPARAHFTVDLNDCAACKHKKYACICCDHDHPHGDAPVPHDHDGDGKPDHGPGEHHHDH